MGPPLRGNGDVSRTVLCPPQPPGGTNHWLQPAHISWAAGDRQCPLPATLALSHGTDCHLLACSFQQILLKTSESRSFSPPRQPGAEQNWRMLPICEGDVGYLRLS